MVEPCFFEQSSRELLALQAAGASGRSEVLAVDHYMSFPAQYYTGYNPTTKKTLGASFGQRFRVTKGLGNPKKLYGAVRRALSRGDERAWMLIGNRAIIEKLDKDWPRDLEKFAEARLGDGHELIVGVRKTPPATAAMH